MGASIAAAKTSVLSQAKLHKPELKPSAGQKFNQVMLELSNSNKPAPLNQVINDMTKLEQALMQGKQFSSRELLLYQMKVGQFGIQVELLSKVGESALSTVKKFEQGA